MTATSHAIVAANLLALRVFDVAYAIDLAVAQATWHRRTGGTAERACLSTTPAKALAFEVAPLQLDLGTVLVTLDNQSCRGEVTARLYDFGVIALSLRISLEHLDWPAFASRLDALDACAGHDAGAFWTPLLAQVRDAVASALYKPSTETLDEEYLVGVIRRLDVPPVHATELLTQPVLPRLLSGEMRPLSASAQREMLQRHFSYFDEDLVILGWDRAFLYDPHADSDILDVLEVANAQLVEFRYYDALLDEELEQMHRGLGQAYRHAAFPIARRFAKLARKLHTLVAEVTELTGKVDNALKVTEDVHLARVYSAALEQFRVLNVAAAVNRKLATIRDTYTALYDEASSRRAEWLEVAIVLLILIEIVLALLGH
ncbi:hypothetical protein [Tahibacter amnicola]|uniref:DUF155 domain-containing protein n=1 Tax=Tahibacter amnicola TaxID=2976241 RepID=A0ABY6B8R9_9GAMM|nr:hypothetical protein [Tahibacter amnicola]UXI66468.1 hypothetical protein N4264_17150 [Tahibacter amnicola]